MAFKFWRRGTDSRRKEKSEPERAARHESVPERVAERDSAAKIELASKDDKDSKTFKSLSRSRSTTSDKVRYQTSPNASYTSIEDVSRRIKSVEVHLAATENRRGPRTSSLSSSRSYSRSSFRRSEHEVLVTSSNQSDRGTTVHQDTISLEPVNQSEDAPRLRIQTSPHEKSGQMEYGRLNDIDATTQDKYDVREFIESLYFSEMEMVEPDPASRAKGSGEWLLQHVDYHVWRVVGRSILWLTGQVGCGKSTLLRFLYTSLLEQVGNEYQHPLVLAFFFDRRGPALKQRQSGLLRSLLYQLESIDSRSSAALSDIFRLRQAKLGKSREIRSWTEDELKDFFGELVAKVASQRELYILVDAPEEAEAESGPEIVLYLLGLVNDSGGNLHVCISSRSRHSREDPEQGLQIRVDDCSFPDILSFVYKIFGRINVDSAVAARVAMLIVERAEGSFIVARYIAQIAKDEFHNGKPEMQIRKNLENTPHMLFDIYRQNLMRSGRTADETGKCFRIFRTLATSDRPISLYDIAELADLPEEYHDDIGLLEKLISRFDIFLYVRNTNVTFSHMSVLEFLNAEYNIAAPPAYDSNEEVQGRILRSFQALQQCSASSATAAEEKQALQRYITRFERWTQSAGAFAKRKASLAYRLRDAPNLQAALHDMLEALELHCQGIMERDTPSAETALTLISSILDWLIDRFLPMIRRTSKREALDRYASVRVLDEDGNDIGAELDAFFSATLARDEPGLGEDLRMRLVDANCLRRRRFVWAKAHYEKLRAGGHQALLQPRKESEQVEDEPETVSQKPQAPQNVPTALSSTHASTTVQDVGETMSLRDLMASKPAPSVVSSAQSAWLTDDEDLTFAAPPKLEDWDLEGLCPYCCLILPRKTLVDRDKWKRHVASDLRPFVCVHSTCPYPTEHFASKSDWMRHLEKPHSEVWKCPLRCDERMSSKARSKSRENSNHFDSREELLRHLQQVHSNDLSAAKIKLLSHRAKPGNDQFRVCPFNCGTVMPDDSDWHAIQSQQFMLRHISTHLLRASLQALPARDDEADEDEDEAAETDLHTLHDQDGASFIASAHRRRQEASSQGTNSTVYAVRYHGMPEEKGPTETTARPGQTPPHRQGPVSTSPDSSVDGESVRYGSGAVQVTADESNRPSITAESSKVPDGQAARPGPRPRLPSFDLKGQSLLEDTVRPGTYRDESGAPIFVVEPSGMPGDSGEAGGRRSDYETRENAATGGQAVGGGNDGSPAGSANPLRPIPQANRLENEAQKAEPGSGLTSQNLRALVKGTYDAPSAGSAAEQAGTHWSSLQTHEFFSPPVGDEAADPLDPRQPRGKKVLKRLEKKQGRQQ